MRRLTSSKHSKAMTRRLLSAKEKPIACRHPKKYQQDYWIRSERYTSTHYLRVYCRWCGGLKSENGNWIKPLILGRNKK